MNRYTAEEVALFGTAPDSQIAAKLGRATKSIERARLDRKIPGYRNGQSGGRWRRFDLLLGTMPDTLIARLMGVSDVAVVKRRRKLGIAAHRYRNRNGRVG
jgi:hypothetical protein